MNTQPDFVFGINVPVNIPSEEEVETLSESLEESLRSLIEADYLSTEEAVAYVKFSTQLASFVPFMMDGFLNSYRSNVERIRDQQE